MIIIINGSGGVGKDTFCKLIRKLCQPYPTRVISSVDYVKKMAILLGWNGEKDEKGRRFLSDLKLALARYDDIPYKKIRQAVYDFMFVPQSYYGILFLHIREPEEIERAKQEFDAITILIKSNRVQQIESNMADANVDNYKYDYVIQNNGSLDDLEGEAKTLLDNIDYGHYVMKLEPLNLISDDDIEEIINGQID